MPSVALGGFVKSRLIASIVVGTAVVLGTAGCNLVAPQATTIDYSASDGVNVPASGPLEVRNALLVGDESGTVGNLVAAIVNPTDQPQTLNIEIGEGSTAVKKSVTVKANSTLSLGESSSDTPPMTFSDITAVPGSTVPVYFQSGDAQGALIDVPVLDGALEYLSTLAPTAPATSTPTPTLTPTPSPSASAGS